MPATYRYPLQTLQVLREAELVPVRASLADVEQRIGSIDRDTACCRDSIQAAEQSLRAGQCEGVLLIEQQRVVRIYLASQRRALSALVATAQSLQLERAQCVAHLQTARSALRMLELHRARLAGAHAISAARKAQNALDDGWLSRLRQRGGAA